MRGPCSASHSSLGSQGGGPGSWAASCCALCREREKASPSQRPSPDPASPGALGGGPEGPGASQSLPQPGCGGGQPFCQKLRRPTDSWAPCLPWPSRRQLAIPGGGGMHLLPSLHHGRGNRRHGLRLPLHSGLVGGGAGAPRPRVKKEPKEGSSDNACRSCVESSTGVWGTHVVCRERDPLTLQRPDPVQQGRGPRKLSRPCLH